MPPNCQDRRLTMAGGATAILSANFDTAVCHRTANLPRCIAEKVRSTSTEHLVRQLRYLHPIGTSDQWPEGDIYMGGIRLAILYEIQRRERTA